MFLKFLWWHYEYANRNSLGLNLTELTKTENIYIFSVVTICMLSEVNFWNYTNSKYHYNAFLIFFFMTSGFMEKSVLIRLAVKTKIQLK